ncbi:MAG: exodeoxyribonuclease III [Aeromicrobium sp.]|uniref:exodeoxyribonuclease III n=1 Tax=Aeromicrobium sp. TaxID=1871063 RepID=UPI0039E5C058
MLRLATVNVNGVRAAWNKNRGQSKGLAEFLAERDCDVVTLQEVRAPDAVVRELLADTGYHLAHAEAVDKGRAGVAVLSRVEPTAVRVGLGAGPDESGRWIEADLAHAGGTLTVVSAYVHTGGVGTPKQDQKYQFLEDMTVRMGELRAATPHAVVTGDLNVAHTPRDIKNAKGNLKKAGFLPEERAYFNRFFGELGWVDVARSLAGDVDGPYTWWSMRGQAFDNDTGWRIDYQAATPDLAATAVSSQVDRAESWAERWSDHAPLVVDYDL